METKSTVDSSLGGGREDGDLSRLRDGWYTVMSYTYRDCAYQDEMQLITANTREGPCPSLLPTRIILVSSPTCRPPLHCPTLYIHTQFTNLEESGLGRGKLNECLAKKKGLPKFESRGMRKDPKCCWRCGGGQGRVIVTITQGWGVQTTFSLHGVHSTTSAANVGILPMPHFLLMVHWHVKDPGLAPNTSRSPSLAVFINSPDWRSSFTTCCLLMCFIFLDSIVCRARRSGSSWCVSWLAPHKRTPPHTHILCLIWRFFLQYIECATLGHRIFRRLLVYEAGMSSLNHRDSINVLIKGP